MLYMDELQKLGERGLLEQLTVKYYKEINNIVYAPEHIADKNMDKLRDIQKDAIEALAKYFEVKTKENEVKTEENKKLSNILKEA